MNDDGAGTRVNDDGAGTRVNDDGAGTRVNDDGAGTRGSIHGVGKALTDPGPAFDSEVAPGGYRWWYIDAVSDDGLHGLTLIAFIGSVFSPYYAWSDRQAPENHVAVNVALYAPGAKRWAMTERGSSHLDRGPGHLTIGPSALAWDGDTLVATIDEIAAPLPARIRGTVRLTPESMTTESFALDPGGHHRWRPIASRARVEVVMERPGVRWSGTGYLDSNAGNEPLDDGFADWDWSRAHRQRDTVVLYDGVRRDGSMFALALQIAADGTVEHVPAPPHVVLPTSGWRMARSTRADAGHVARVTRTWEDSPFYVRSALRTRLFGEDCAAVHESLSLDRFRMGIVRAMLPFRMPRRG